MLDAPPASPQPLPEVFPLPAPPGWPNPPWVAGRAGIAAGSWGARPPAQGAEMGIAEGCAQSSCPLPVPIPLACPTSWPSWPSAGMRRSSSSSSGSPDHAGTKIQLAAWGDKEKVGSCTATVLPGAGTPKLPLPGQESPAWCGPEPPSWPGPCPGGSGPSSSSPGSRHSPTGRGSAWQGDRAVGTLSRGDTALSHRGSPAGQHHHLISFFLGSSTSRSFLA